MSINFNPSNMDLPAEVTASGNMEVSGNLNVVGVLTAGGISGSGEANTASNVGGATGIFKQKSGVDLQFKTLAASGITLNSYTNVIGLTASAAAVGGSDKQVQFNRNGSFAGDSGLTYDGSGSLSFGSAANDFHRISGSLNISGSRGGLLNVRGDVTASNSVSASAFYGTNFSAASVDIDGGTIDGANITVGSGKTLDVSAGTLTLANDQISGDKIQGGTIASTTITALASTTISASTHVSSSNIFVNDVEANYVTASTHVSSSNVLAKSVRSDLFKNSYFSASIGSNTSVPTNVYNFFNYTVTANLSLTASSPVAGASYVFILRQDAGGTNVITFDSSTFKFPSGSAPSMSTGSHEVDVVSGISDGIVIYANAAKKFS
jgi:hypothetical protein